MNIIKFEDIILDSTSGLPEGAITFFNTNLKAKYAYAVNWEWIFTLDLTQANYKNYSQNGVAGLTKDTDYMAYDDVMSYINLTATTEANIAEKWKYINSFSPDSDITLEELKNFRTWLATLLYANQSWISEWASADSTIISKVNQMLTYYKGGMYDSVVKGLVDFNIVSSAYTLPVTRTSGCGCQGGIYNIQGSSITICDPLATYRKNIYNYMVKVFSDYIYWSGQPEICTEMKKYIDGILAAGLPLTSSVTYSVQCACLDSNEQANMEAILRRLSKALQYIIDGEVDGNHNYITEAFKSWSTYLYEKMQWS